MASNIKASDWQCVGVAQVGGASVLGAGIFIFEFRSRSANYRGKYLFMGGGIGVGGSLGGGVCPSPVDVARNVSPNLWTDLRCTRSFSADDLDWAKGQITILGAGAAIGYSLMRLTASTLIIDNNMFKDQNANGWGTGVGAVGAILLGNWIGIEDSKYY